MMFPSTTARQFAKFCSVGILNTALHYTVFLLLWRTGGLHYLLASTLGYCCGLLNSFFWNRFWTFQQRDGNRRVQFLRFIGINLAALIINIATLRFMVSTLSLSPELGQILTIALTMSVNFTGNKLWTFRDPAQYER